jgi:two-component system sensor histidine kinase KdpD
MRQNRFDSPFLPRLATYIIPPVFTLLTGGVLSLFREEVSLAVVAMAFLVPVAFSATSWGLGPGVTAALSAFLSFNYLFIQPYYTFAVHNSGDLVVLFVFLGAAILISQLAGRARASLASATARELETFQLYELSVQMAGAQDEQRVVQTLAQKTLEALQAIQVEVFIEGSPPIQARMNLGDKIQPDRPTLLIPIATARGLLGEIRIWREDNVNDQERTERTLKTFANQTALTIERLRLAETARRMKILEETDRFKSSLLSSVSHELRSPLATIKASVSSLRSEEVAWDSDARRELLSAVEEETDHLNLLVGNLLDMSRLEAGSLRPNLQPNVLADVIHSTLKRMRLQMEEHPVRVVLPDDLPILPVDFVLMEQVFSNLLSNSAKFSPAGSPISIRAYAEKEVVQIEIANQGPGVPEEHLQRIFDKFYRITAADKVTGTGLGLSICKGIVEAHGGKIWAENLERGVAFKFTLPRSTGKA